ncbi:MAG: hypothetical protein F9K19_17325 [Rhizobiaceae bacterium]|nr:MAG: hypothetical protein F9K19_17325 [Rhizobiaceae bacterium]
MKNWTFRDAAFARAWDICSAYTMTSPERGFALWNAVGHIAREGIPGCLVECGTWKGGSAMLMILAGIHHGLSGREIFLFDTFEGMTPPTAGDVDVHGRSAEVLLEKSAENKTSELIWAYATLDEVRKNIGRVLSDLDNVHFIKGDVVETLPRTVTGPIALLRLDTDFYESTQAELAHLYKQVSEGGILIVDDYGHWSGAQKAVDEFFGTLAAGERPFLSAIDYTGRIGVKPNNTTKVAIQKYDYVPPRFADPRLLRAFPTLIEGDVSAVKWPFLRKPSPHIWRTDTRSKRENIGVLSYEEALVLYNVGLQFKGKPGLEIGCHLAWSTVHLLAAGLQLDIIDPALGDEDHIEAVRQSISRSVGSEALFRSFLYPGYSPGLVEPAARRRKAKWALAFIDGFHDKGAPLKDTKAVLPFMARDAVVMFHDLLCPDVLLGLEHCEEEGWNTRVLNTTQVMGIAWRGDVSIPAHRPDPQLPLPNNERLRRRLANS